MRTAVMVSAVLLVAAGSGRADIPKKKDIPKYIEQLQSTSAAPRVRAAAAEALGERGAIRKADVKDGIDALIKAVTSDPDANVRKAAAMALGRINPDDKAAVKPLMEALKDKSNAVKVEAARALGLLGSDAKEAVDALREVKQEADKISGGKKKKKTKPTKAEREARELARAAQMAIQSIGGRRKKK